MVRVRDLATVIVARPENLRRVARRRARAAHPGVLASLKSAAHPLVLAEAVRLASGDASRLLVQRDGSIIVANSAEHRRMIQRRAAWGSAGIRESPRREAEASSVAVVNGVMYSRVLTA
ncbi:hypothetical protein [Sinomonas sp. B1-1]|uniref:hypothetical protein n=1 Tax=Sinomonas sp. B1-1 TaxID=3141454 RepID=UPI003D271FA9